MTVILKYTPEAIKSAAQTIKNGGIVAFPTETVYGVGASAFDPDAIIRIYEIKKRPRFDPLIVHISSLADLEELTLGIDKQCATLIEKFWPGPLTLVLNKSSNVPDIVTAGLNTIAVRMPDHKIALELVTESGVPIAAPSANMFGSLSPTAAEHVIKQLGEKVDIIIDGGKTKIGVESTILDMTGEPTILRPGGVSVEDIEKIIGKVKILTYKKRPSSPGQLPKHYAPRIPLKIIENGDSISVNTHNAGLIAFKKPPKKVNFKKVEVLSPTGDLKEAACNLFSILHRLESSGVEMIYVEKVPEVGLGVAIMDRLRKAGGLKNG